MVLLRKWREASLVRRRRKLADGLCELGFYRYTSQTEGEVLKTEFIRQGHVPLYDLFHGTNRMFPVLYKEETQPGWMKQAFKSIAQVLGESGVLALSELAEERSENSVVLRIGQNTWRTEIDPQGEDDLDLAERQLLLCALNDMLKSSGSEEKAWHAWGEKYESLYLLLTPEQREAITQSGIVPDPIESAVKNPSL